MRHKDFTPICEEYIPIGRELLVPDYLEQGELPRYERDIAVRSYVIPKRGSVPTSVVEAEELLVPVVELSSNPTVKMNEQDQRTYDILERMEMRAFDSIRRQEDVETLKVINAAVPCDHIISVTNSVEPRNLILAITLLEEHEIHADKIVMHPMRLKDLRIWAEEKYSSSLDLNSLKELYATGIAGTFLGLTIYVSTMCAKNCVYVMAPKEFVGVIPIRRDIESIQADEPKRLRLGKIVHENLGFAVINDYAISKIVVGGNSFWSVAERLAAFEEDLKYDDFVKCCNELSTILDNYLPDYKVANIKQKYPASDEKQFEYRSSNPPVDSAGNRTDTD